MKAVWLTLLLISSLTFLILVIVGKQAIFQHSKLIAAFFLFYFVDNLSIIITNHFPILQLIPNHLWENYLLCGWSGKVYSCGFPLHKRRLRYSNTCISSPHARVKRRACLSRGTTSMPRSTFPETLNVSVRQNRLEHANTNSSILFAPRPVARQSIRTAH